MTIAKPTLPNEEKIRTTIRELRPFIDDLKHTQFLPNQLYSFCLRSSLIKCFELLEESIREETFEISFFMVPALRGICEDLIILGYMSTLASTDREEIIHGLTNHSLLDRAEVQHDFFSSTRPFQKVIYAPGMTNDKEMIKQELQQLWAKYGWNNLRNRVIPSTRELAAKQGTEFLALLYDYLFRLTSSTVHFSPQHLIRAGWGATMDDVTLTTKNFSAYYSFFARTYCAILFCLYFEVFDSELNPAKETQALTRELRNAILGMQRWPEIVTFEEMNRKPPPFGALDVLHVILTQEKYQDGFLAPK